MNVQRIFVIAVLLSMLVAQPAFAHNGGNWDDGTPSSNSHGGGNWGDGTPSEAPWDPLLAWLGLV
jgi:hypothetical protein